jgi:hypothetical protein
LRALSSVAGERSFPASLKAEPLVLENSVEHVFTCFGQSFAVARWHGLKEEKNQQQ